MSLIMTLLVFQCAWGFREMKPPAMCIAFHILVIYYSLGEHAAGQYFDRYFPQVTTSCRGSLPGEKKTGSRRLAASPELRPSFERAQAKQSCVSHWTHRPPTRQTHRSSPHMPIRRAAAHAEAAKLAPHDAQTGAERGEARNVQLVAHVRGPHGADRHR